MSRRGKMSVGAVVGLVTVLAGTALAISNIAFKLGTISSYDFGGYGPGYPVPGTIQIQGFKMNPGETVPWHFHKGLSYVILSHGTLTETHQVGPDQCASEELTQGNAFVEGPGHVHSVSNTGKDVAVIWWATIYPKSDGPGGIYPATPPNCNWALSFVGCVPPIAAQAADFGDGGAASSPARASPSGVFIA